MSREQTIARHRQTYRRKFNYKNSYLLVVAIIDRNLARHLTISFGITPLVLEKVLAKYGYEIIKKDSYDRQDLRPISLSTIKRIQVEVFGLSDDEAEKYRKDIAIDRAKEKELQNTAA